MNSEDFALIVAFVAIAGNFALGMYSFINVKRLRSRVNFLTEDKVLPVIIKRECSSSINKATSTDEDNIVVEVNSDESEFHDVELKQSDKEEKNSTKDKRYSLWPLY